MQDTQLMERAAASELQLHTERVRQLENDVDSADVVLAEERLTRRQECAGLHLEYLELDDARQQLLRAVQHVQRLDSPVSSPESGCLALQICTAVDYTVCRVCFSMSNWRPPSLRADCRFIMNLPRFT